jgi:hypothetical protein
MHRQDIRQAWRGARVNQRCALFLLKLPLKMELFGPEWILPQVRRCIQIVSAQSQGRTENNFVQNSRTGVDE